MDGEQLEPETLPTPWVFRVQFAEHNREAVPGSPRMMLVLAVVLILIALFLVLFLKKTRERTHSKPSDGAGGDDVPRASGSDIQPPNTSGLRSRRLSPPHLRETLSDEDAISVDESYSEEAQVADIVEYLGPCFVGMLTTNLLSLILKQTWSIYDYVALSTTCKRMRSVARLNDVVDHWAEQDLAYWIHCYRMGLVSLRCNWVETLPVHYVYREITMEPNSNQLLHMTTGAAYAISAYLEYRLKVGVKGILNKAFIPIPRPVRYVNARPLTAEFIDLVDPFDGRTPANLFQLSSASEEAEDDSDEEWRYSQEESGSSTETSVGTRCRDDLPSYCDLDEETFEIQVAAGVEPFVYADIYLFWIAADVHEHTPVELEPHATYPELPRDVLRQLDGRLTTLSAEQLLETDSWGHNVLHHLWRMVDVSPDRRAPLQLPNRMLKITRHLLEIQPKLVALANYVGDSFLHVCAKQCSMNADDIEMQSLFFPVYELAANYGADFGALNRAGMSVFHYDAAAIQNRDVPIELRDNKLMQLAQQLDSNCSTDSLKLVDRLIAVFGMVEADGPFGFAPAREELPSWRVSSPWSPVEHESISLLEPHLEKMRLESGCDPAALKLLASSVLIDLITASVVLMRHRRSSTLRLFEEDVLNAVFHLTS